jgi:hypothetical protein
MMYPRYALTLLLILPVLSVACDGAAKDESSLLTEMVLQPEDVPSNFALSRAEPVSDDFFAEQLADRYGMSPGEVPDGWLEGYLSSFLDHPAYVTNRVDLFSTDTQASAFLAAPLKVSREPPFQVEALGDEAMAYPVGAPGCPCIIRFRQDNAVAEVYFEGPGGTGELEDTLGLARKVEQHIAEALGD